MTPYATLLPGRTQWLYVCHAQPAGCPLCLRTIAGELAFELDFDLAAAVDRSADYYRRLLGPEFCTYEQALELRRLTCRMCVIDDDLSDSVILADDLAPQETPVVSTIKTSSVPLLARFAFLWAAGLSAIALLLQIFLVGRSRG